MHPAYSVIIFTAASGAGYGLMFWLSLTHAFGFAPDDRWMLFAGMAIALALVTLGLVSSTLHLGHPERAMGAFSQWRSSWLSREGIAAVVTYAPSGMLALIWMLGLETGLTIVLGVFAAFSAIVTVYCTGMIYASLRTIRQWHLGLVPAIYLALAAATGAVLLALIMGVFGHAPLWMVLVALICLGVAGLLKRNYWRTIDSDPGQYTAEMATGLGGLGAVRPLDPPHTKPNFVMREMGYQVARSHALKLRGFVMLSLFAAPAVLILASQAVAPAFLIFLACIAVAIGVVLERWLFFAEAEHVSMLFYGVERA